MNAQELVEKVIFSMKSLDVLLEKGVSHTVESATKIPICDENWESKNTNMEILMKISLFVIILMVRETTFYRKKSKLFIKKTTFYTCEGKGWLWRGISTWVSQFLCGWGISGWVK